MMQRQKKPLPPNPSLVSYIHLLRSETLLTKQPALLPGWFPPTFEMHLSLKQRDSSLDYTSMKILTVALSFLRNGPEFEARIRQNEINNPKFNFLNPNDPYHAYYRHKVNEFKEGKAQEPSAAVPKVMQQQALQQSQQLPQKVRHCISVC